jgi:hypothetical protein
LEPMFIVRSLTDRNQEFANLPATDPVDAKHVPQVTVGSLIEGPH